MVLREPIKDSGSLMVTGLVEGLRAEKSMLIVLLQSIYSVESWVAQNCLSSSSVLKLGIGFRFLFLAIYSPFFFVLVSG